MNKKGLSERDICTKFITPALKDSGWNIKTQIREEVAYTAGKIFVRGKLVQRGKQKRIVEKVNELMGLCNALEEKLTKKEATAEKLVGAVVNRISKN